jgi:hypothetical protein
MSAAKSFPIFDGMKKRQKEGIPQILGTAFSCNLPMPILEYLDGIDPARTALRKL